MKLDEFYTIACPVEGCEGKVMVRRSMPDGYAGLCPCRAVRLRVGWAHTAGYDRVPYLVVVPEEPKRRRRSSGGSRRRWGTTAHPAGPGGREVAGRPAGGA